MNLSEAYLCPGCDEVFHFRNNTDSTNGSVVHYPVCPGCGNKNNLHLAKALNRTENKHP